MKRFLFLLVFSAIAVGISKLVLEPWIIHQLPHKHFIAQATPYLLPAILIFILINVFFPHSQAPQPGMNGPNQPQEGEE